MSGKIVTLIITMLAFSSCNIPDDDGGKPSPPGARWIKPTVFYDSLPGYYDPGTLTFTIRFIGEDGSVPVSNVTGDSLRWLLLFFRASEGSKWLDGVNAVTKSEWYWYDSVTVGQEIVLQPRYQITKEGDFGNLIKLMYAFHTYSIEIDSIKQVLLPDTSYAGKVVYVDIWGAWEFGFNHITGDTATGF